MFSSLFVCAVVVSLPQEVGREAVRRVAVACLPLGAVMVAVCLPATRGLAHATPIDPALGPSISAALSDSSAARLLADFSSPASSAATPNPLRIAQREARKATEPEVPDTGRLRLFRAARRPPEASGDIAPQADGNISSSTDNTDVDAYVHAPETSENRKPVTAEAVSLMQLFPAGRIVSAAHPAPSVMSFEDVVGRPPVVPVARPRRTARASKALQSPVAEPKSVVKGSAGTGSAASGADRRRFDS